MELGKVFVDSVIVGKRHRAAVPDKVDSLAESLKAIGLQQPISVYVDEQDAAYLVAGLHRLEAARKLGWEEIDATFLRMSSDDRELWEIDENLCRAELKPTEEAGHIARRKELWERRVVSEQVVPKPQGGRPAGFATDTAARTGKTKQHINRVIRRATEVTSEARDLIRNTALDTGAYLDRLMKVPEAQQVERVERDLAALKEKERSETLRREAAERDREAKEAKKRAKITLCDFLLDALSSRQWDRLIGLLEDAGGSLKASDLREWQAPMKAGEAA